MQEHGCRAKNQQSRVPKQSLLGYVKVIWLILPQTWPFKEVRSCTISLTSSAVDVHLPPLLTFLSYQGCGSWQAFSEAEAVKVVYSVSDMFDIVARLGSFKDRPKVQVEVRHIAVLLQAENGAHVLLIYQPVATGIFSFVMAMVVMEIICLASKSKHRADQQGAKVHAASFGTGCSL